MILQRLIEHSQTLAIPPTRYGEVPVKWVIELDTEGHMTGLSALAGEDSARDRGKMLVAPVLGKKRSVAPEPILLVDTGEYVLGLPSKKERTEKARIYHQVFMQLVERCAEKTELPQLNAVRIFLANLPEQDVELPSEFDPSMNVTFRVNGRYPFDMEAVKEFWKIYNQVQDDSGVKCHICNENPPEPRLPAVKGTPGGHSSGTPLISANKEAFESYGLEASLVGPTCIECAEKFTLSLNHLLQDENSRIRIGNQVYVFWSKGDAFTPVSLLARPDQENFWDFLDSDEEIDLSVVEPDDPQQVKEVLRSAFTGRRGAIDRETEGFYAAAFSGSGGRVVVRDWLETTIPEVKRNLAQFFYNGHLHYHSQPFSIYALARATVRDMNDLPPQTLTQLLNHALRGSRLAEGLLYRAIRRNQAEQRVTASRVALIKIYFISNNQFAEEGNDMSALNPNQREPAYLCGRLLSVLEEIQHGAQGSSSVVDRFYGTASTAPATVFSRLISLSRHHLAKLKRDKPGYQVNLEKKLQEIMNDLSEFPAVLTLQQQGLFALGFYHQREERFSKPSEQVAEEEEK